MSHLFKAYIMKRNSIFVRMLTILAIKCVSVYSDGESCGGPASSIIAAKDSASCGYYSNTKGPKGIKTSFGAPVSSLTASLTVGRQGPILLQDSVLIDELQHFNRERIPERVVHAKGAGAFGYFECTNGDIAKYTKATVFSKIGHRTAVAARFSVIAGESGSADTVREPRGFAIKFYTQDGIWDVVGLSSATFFIRDPMLFPSLIHSQKKNPVTNLKDPTAYWDFLSLRPETMNEVMFTFSDQGIPNGYRYMEGHGVHSFRLVNKAGQVFYAKFHFLPDQVKYLPSDVAANLTGIDPDYATRDLYTAIENGTIPSWTMYIQIMTLEQAKYHKYAFDITKVLPSSEFPFISVGKLVLNKNPTNYFADIEQLAFAPRNLIPGIEPSPDKVFQGRIFSYSDTQMHRLGPNHLQLPVNCPYQVHVTNYQRNGPQTFYNQQGAPNYYPNSFGGPEPDPRDKLLTFPADGIVDRYDTGDEDNFDQPRQFWTKELSSGERTRLVQNIVASLKDAIARVQERALSNFYKVDKTFGDLIHKGLMKAKMS